LRTTPVVYGNNRRANLALEKGAPRCTWPPHTLLLRWRPVQSVLPHWPPPASSLDRPRQPSRWGPIDAWPRVGRGHDWWRGPAGRWA